MVIAVPLPACVQGDQEHVRAGSSESTAAESSRPRTASHNPGVNRPSTEMRSRNFLTCGASAVRTNRSGSRQRAERCRRTPAHPRWGLEVAKPQRCQIQPSRPSLRPLQQQLNTLAGQLNPLTHEQLTRFFDRESKLPRANLHQRPSRPQARDSDRRLRARRHEQAHIGRQPLDRMDDRAKRTLTPDRVQVIEHDRYRTTVRDQAFINSSTAVSTGAPRTPRHISARPPRP